MPSIVTASQLRTVLGVSVSLYPDAYLNDIIDTSEAVILPMLVANVSGVDQYKLDADVAFFYTIREHYFVAGQSVIVAGLPAPFTATHTVVTAAPYYFTGKDVSSDFPCGSKEYIDADKASSNAIIHQATQSTRDGAD